MASLSGVSSSNTMSSLYNSANIISGLASGLDTEGMIENLVKGYQTKISQLNQKATKTEWKQEAYRSIINKMVGFSNKYVSYTSNTNLMSPSFFSSAVKVLTKGDFADSVSASGKTSSDISLNAVHQLAKAAQYRTKSNMTTSVKDAEGNVINAITGTEVDLSAGAEKNIKLSNLSGSLTLTYGSKTVSINFNESTTAKEFDDIREQLATKNNVAKDEVADADVLAGYINQKLADEKIVFNSGDSESADKRIKAVADGDSIRFEELGTAKNGVYISGASGNIAEKLGLSEDDLKDAKDKKITEFSTDNIEKDGLTRKLNAIEYLTEKSKEAGEAGVKLGMNISLNGSSKTIAMPVIKDGKLVDADGNALKDAGGNDISELTADNYTKALQTEVKKAFGDKVTVENKGENGALKLEFRAKNEGDELVINTGVGEALGIGNTATSYLNTSKTLGELLGDKLNSLETVKDKDGNDAYEFKINDVVVGTFTKDSKLSDVLNAINSNEEAGVSVAYSRTTQSFTFTAKETGSDSKVELGDGLAAAMFGVDTTQKTREYMGLDTLKGQNVTLSVKGEDGSDKEVVVVNFTFKKNDSSLDAMLKQFNAQLDKGDTGLKASISGSGSLILTDKQGNRVDYTASEGLGKELQGKTSNAGYTEGKDAVFTVTVNGEQKTMTRSSNSVDIDGLTITMEDTFNSKVDKDGNPIRDNNGKFQVDNTNKSVTFQSKTDSDKIIDAIKSMVEDYNSMMSEIKSAYSTMPYQSSSGAFANYEPLTDEDREGMSESAIERYEAKAKQGILFGDRNLSNLYSRMNDAFSFTSTNDIDTLKDMGITMGYSISEGGSSIQIDEDKLRAMLDSDPDRVANLFTKTNGIMDRMKTELDYYSKTTGEPKGVLIQQAGSPLSSLSLMNNTWQQQIDNYTEQIEKWQDKMSNQVDRYTQQFSRLEQLINQMNSQSSALAGLMGGG